MRQERKKGMYESNKIVYLPTDSVKPNPDQPRKQFEPGALGELAESIRRCGILQPLTVRRAGKDFELVSGERRLRAAKLIGVKRVPCIIVRVEPEESSVLALVENLQRKDLDFIEEAEGLSRLIQVYGLSQEEAARRVGKSQSAVANKLRILKLPGEILYIIRQEGLTERHARALLRIQDPQQRIAVLDRIIKKGLNVAQTEEYIDSLLNKPEPEQKGDGQKKTYVIKDVRLFLNTISHSMDVMRKSGIDASMGKDETEEDIVLTIRIPKSSKAGQGVTIGR